MSQEVLDGRTSTSIVYGRLQTASGRSCRVERLARRLTYIETDEGWLHLAAVMNLYSPRIVGWAMQEHLRTELPLAALRMAISAQRPSTDPIHLSDRGVQHASTDYHKTVQSAGFRASMNRKADCYDNAPMESFFHTLKTERVHHRQHATRAEAQRDIFAYIEGFYNRSRRHGGLPADVSTTSRRWSELVCLLVSAVRSNKSLR